MAARSLCADAPAGGRRGLDGGRTIPSHVRAFEQERLVSGHSRRAGYATSAAARDMPGYRFQQHTRHKSAQMVAGYIREADKWTKSGLKGVGF